MKSLLLDKNGNNYIKKSSDSAPNLDPSFWIIDSIQSPVCLCICPGPVYRCTTQSPEKNAIQSGVYWGYRDINQFSLVVYRYPESWN